MSHPFDSHDYWLKATVKVPKPLVSTTPSFDREIPAAYMQPAPYPVPSFTKAAKPELDVGTGSHRITSGAYYVVCPLGREKGGAQRVQLTVYTASFNAKQLRELTAHLNALASAMEATE